MQPRSAPCTLALVVSATAMATGIPTAAAAGESGGAGREGRDLFGTRGGARKSPPENAPVPATVTWSDGRRETGKLSFTAGVPLTVYDLEAKEWVDVELSDLATLEAVPREENLDREWRWKDYGDDEKVYTGRERPRRWLDHALTLGDRRAMKVHVKGTVMYLDTVAEPERPAKDEAEAGAAKPDGKPGPDAKPVRRRLIIRQYDRGDWGDTLASLVYVKRIEIGEPDAAPKRAPGPAAKRPAAE